MSLSLSQIEAEAIKMHNAIIDSGISNDPMSHLDPFLAFDVLGYNIKTEQTLDYLAKNKTKIAGAIYPDKKEVQIATSYEPEIQRFTLAHELGHALLHKGMPMHRDRPIDGSTKGIKRSEKELEADKFAVFFLMPEILIKQRFIQMFLTDSFILNEDSNYALDPSNSLNLLEKCKSKRYLSRILVEARRYNTNPFKSLIKQFGVSKETIAIRLEELNLIKFN